MKSNALVKLSLGFLCISPLLASCNGKAVVKVEKDDMVFQKNAYVELTNMPERIHIKIDLASTPDYINVSSRIKLYDDSYSYKDGVLSILGSSLLDENNQPRINSGDRALKIKVGDNIIEKKVLFVDKVIKTASDLQKINDNPLGSYVLGNDIDCSSISNFEPLGFITSDTSSRVNQEFNGVFDGNGYAIKNVTSRYALDVGSGEEAYKGNYLFEDESHRVGDSFGVFQVVGPTGVVRNTSFSNCNIYGRTISGVIAGQNLGLIENCFVDATCSASISTHFYDESCNVGALCGLNSADDENECVRNCISLAKCYISDTYIDYNDEYLGITENGHSPESNTWNYYGATKGSDKLDSNGVETNGVYAGIGISYGAAYNNYCQDFDIRNQSFTAPAQFGQTHIYANKNADGPSTGTLVNCLIKSNAELKSSALYDTFSTDSWNVFDGSIPTLKAYYSYYLA